MNHNYIKKLERVLIEYGIDGANGYEMESLIDSAILSQAKEQGYDFEHANEFDEECVNVPIELNYGLKLEVEGSINRTTKYYNGPDAELPYNEINIDNVYVIDKNGNKKNCNFSYSYE